MTVRMNIKRNLSRSQIWNIYKFELFLQKKKFKIMLLLTLVFYNVVVIFTVINPPADAKSFAGGAVGQIGPFLIFITLFFAGGVLADEFDKRTALTNFTKTGRDNFFFGKTLGAFTSVLAWIGPAFVETMVFCLILYGQLPIELFIWFGYYCLVGGMYVALYLLHSAYLRSSSQAMAMGFFTFIGTTIAFGIMGAVFGLWYLFPIYAEIAATAIWFGPDYTGGMIVDMWYGIIMCLCYLIPSIIFAYIGFRKRDV